MAKIIEKDRSECYIIKLVVANTYIPIEINTDLKAAKYQKCGLKVSEKKKFTSGVVMYSLEYR